jgi:2-oxoglutarate/2-oxoacid ferredoxin oxidoreductase subunit alpha
MGIRKTIPTPEVYGNEGGLLAISWGSTYGAVRSAVAKMIEDGQKVAQIHLRHLYPLPDGLEEIFARSERIIVPELNLGQLAFILQAEYPDFRFAPYDKVQGKPFTAFELRETFTEMLEVVS